MSLLGPKVRPNHLSLRGSFTDRGMRHLRGLDGLFSLDIDDSRLGITAAGARAAGLASASRRPGRGREDELDAECRGEVPNLRFLAATGHGGGDDGSFALGADSCIDRMHLGTPMSTTCAVWSMDTGADAGVRGCRCSCLNVDDAGASALGGVPGVDRRRPWTFWMRETVDVGRPVLEPPHPKMVRPETHRRGAASRSPACAIKPGFNSYTTIMRIQTLKLLSVMGALERMMFPMCRWPRRTLCRAGSGAAARAARAARPDAAGSDVTAVKRRVPAVGQGVFLTDGWFSGSRIAAFYKYLTRRAWAQVLEKVHHSRRPLTPHRTPGRESPTPRTCADSSVSVCSPCR